MKFYKQKIKSIDFAINEKDEIVLCYRNKKYVLDTDSFYNTSGMLDYIACCIIKFHKDKDFKLLEETRFYLSKASRSLNKFRVDLPHNSTMNIKSSDYNELSLEIKRCMDIIKRKTK